MPKMTFKEMREMIAEMFIKFLTLLTSIFAISLIIFFIASANSNTLFSYSIKEINKIENQIENQIEDQIENAFN